MSPPLEVDGGSLRIRDTWLDRQELRIALLFWDRLVWPASKSVYLQGGRDEQFLERVGILNRPVYATAGDVAQTIAQIQIQAFRDLEQREPGAWALAQGENSFLLREHVLEEGRGALVELHRAIPVPDKDVPLQDILEFREKRRAELICLRVEIDEFFESINNAEDKQFELRRHIETIDAACNDLLKIGREWRFPLRLSDLRVSFEMSPFAAISAGAGAWVWGIEQELSTLNSSFVAGLAAGAASIKISRDFGLRNRRLHSSPFRYVYRFYREVF